VSASNTYGGRRQPLRGSGPPLAIVAATCPAGSRTEAIGGTLIRAGCFLCAYELIQSEIVPKVRDFFLEGFNEQGYLYDEVGYNRTVRSLNPKNKFDASCDWLVARGALTAEQVATLKRVQAHRNDIAHKLPELLVDPDFEIQTDWGALTLVETPAVVSLPLWVKYSRVV
jgi:hypothetical protein